MRPLQNIINDYKSKPLTELEFLIDKDNHFEFSKNDKNYQIVVNLLWDDQAKKVMRMDVFTDYLTQDGRIPRFILGLMGKNKNGWRY